MTELRICEFCDRQLEDSEELHPVYIGEPPEPSGERAMGIAEVQDRRGHEVVGMDVGYYDAIRRAFDDVRRASDVIDVTVDVGVPVQKIGQQEPVAVAGAEIDPANPSPAKFETESADAVRIVIEYDAESIEYPEPDLQVCSFCKDGLRGDDDG